MTRPTCAQQTLPLPRERSLSSKLGNKGIQWGEKRIMEKNMETTVL